MPGMASISPKRAARLKLGCRIAIPSVLFAFYQRLAYLNPLAAPRMMVGGDWTTYLVSPNYLRGAPWVTFPFGGIPHYLAPHGSSLGKTDSLPVLTPVYRVLLALFPHRPIQLVGVILFAGVLLTFNAVARFLDHVHTDLSPLRRELVTLMLASLVVLAPFWTLQYNHPALMQAWIVVWALCGALRRCPTVLGGAIEQTDRPWTGLGPIVAAAAVQPYFVPMTFSLGLAPDLARAGTYRRFLVKKLAVAVALVAAIGLFLGYLGSTKLGSGGFGSYAADLSTLVDPDDRSRFVADIVTAPDAIGGYGYVGLGGLVLLCTAAFLCRREARLRTPGDDPPPTPERLPARFVYGAIGVLTVYGVLPQVRVFNRVTFDFSRITDRLSSLTEVFRVNGRFIWPLAWLLLMLAAAQTVRARRARTAVLVAALVLWLQIADVIPYPALWRPAGAAEFAAARRALEAEQQSGGTGIEVQPPVVIPGCYDGTIKFDQLGDVLLAAAVLGLPVNSGYTAREEPAAVAQICEAQARAFREGSFSPQTIYVLRDASIPPGLTCHPLTTGLVACRSSTTT